MPVTPEYIGYQDVGLSEGMLTALKPSIEEFSDNTFKYRLDVDNLVVGDDIGALCVSRPTNPTGNVLTNGEIEELDRRALEAGVPLIIDNASSDQTDALLARVDGATIVRNADNLGFVLAANQGAALARGRHLLLLNNDAIVQQGALAGERAMTQAKSWGSWPARYSSSSAAIRLRK